MTVRHRVIMTVLLCAGLCLTLAPSIPSSALTFKKGESIDFSKRDASGDRQIVGLRSEKEAFIFDDPDDNA